MENDRRRRARTLLMDSEASTTVEFVAIMSFFVILMAFVLEILLAQFWWQTAEKAVQMGVRLAIVSDVAATGVPATNTKSSTGVYGQKCSAGNCVGFTTAVCSGGGAGCNTTAFNYIVNRMRDTYLPIQDSYVTITYSYSGLGYAGGPTIPFVTVELSGLPFRTGIIPIVGSLIGTGATPLTTVSARSVTMTGEDLRT